MNEANFGLFRFRCRFAAAAAEGGSSRYVAGIGMSRHLPAARYACHAAMA
jgi:hypothetical protein